MGLRERLGLSKGPEQQSSRIDEAKFRRQEQVDAENGVVSDAQLQVKEDYRRQLEARIEKEAAGDKEKIAELRKQLGLE